MRCIEIILQRQVVVQNFLKIFFMNNSDEYFVGNSNNVNSNE